ncbi:putative short-chain dehydrogenase [Aspergillus bombycis]|uniref:Putative short-chain dehydrogenase n=1 Tax=Aspergillus bombycis TaxID=109264 RepID=A0A1F8A868_9EURO|nr:putative short-chain dehydrogenase [Aspergillus bombycis]OGM47970.1 putative short-chain dehydrogenase [Aspergillus bombycis]
MSTTNSSLNNSKGGTNCHPTALEIIKSNGLEGKLQGKVILITGCSSGIGIDTARALSVTGATLYLTARDLKKAEKALGDLIKQPNVHLLTLNLDSLVSVRACAEAFLSKSSQLNILINNAAVMATPEGRTQDGFETQFGTNHLGHFTLFYLLKPTLLASSTPEFHSRVVNVSSMAHRWGEPVFENINLEGIYEPWRAYGQSKTANIWTANEIERRYGSQGLHAFSVHPGGIRTGLQQYVPQEQRDAWDKDDAISGVWKTSEHGAATTIWAAVAQELEGKGGKYLEDCQIADKYDPSTGTAGKGYAPWAYDKAKQTKLWEMSLNLAGLHA